MEIASPCVLCFSICISMDVVLKLFCIFLVSSKILFMTQKDARCSSVIWPKMTFWSMCPQSLWMLSHWYLCSLQFTLIRCTLSYKTFIRLVIASLHLRVWHPDFSLTFPLRLTCHLNSQSPCSYKVGCVVGVWKEVLLRKTSTLSSDWLGGHSCASELGQPWSGCLGSVEPCGKARGSRGQRTEHTGWSQRASS